MIISSKQGNIRNTAATNKQNDVVQLQWHECRKRVMVKKTVEGKELKFRFLNENPEFATGDILYEDDEQRIIVEISPCTCLVITPGNMIEAASISYEIGNQHVPLFFEDGQLLTPYEKPLNDILRKMGFKTARETRILAHPIKTTVTPHTLTDLNIGAASIIKIKEA